MTVGERDKFYQAVRDASELLTTALKERMPDAPIIAALLKLFDGRAFPDPVPSDYGSQHLETVIRHFAPHAAAKEAAAAAAADPDDDALETAADLARKRSDKIEAPDYICADKLRSEWSRFKFQVLKHKRGVGYRDVYRAIAVAADNMGYGEMVKLGSVLVLIALQNAIAERGFSLMNHTKTKKKARLDKGLDPKMRVVSLGPTDEGAITALVDSCTTTVFGKSRPARAIGAAASHKKRREVKEETAKGRMTAADVIKGENNKAVSGDGTEAPTAASEAEVAFPEDKYKTDVPMPTLDKTLKGKKILYLFDDQDGNGLKYKPFTVKSAKKPVRADATGVALAAPMFVYKLQRGKSGESFKSKLLPEQYGITKKWYLAVKK